MSVAGELSFQNIVWRTPEGKVVACHEKIKVMREALEELRQVAQDALEDAILMECDEHQVRAVFHQIMDSLENPYQVS